MSNDRKFEEVLARLLEKGVKPVTINRLRRIAMKFATPDAFFGASRGELLAKFNEENPSGSRSLGEGFFEAFDDALALYKSRPEFSGVTQAAEAKHPLDVFSFTQDKLLRLASFMDEKQKVENDKAKVESREPETVSMTIRQMLAYCDLMGL